MHNISSNPTHLRIDILSRGVRMEAQHSITNILSRGVRMVTPHPFPGCTYCGPFLAKAFVCDAGCVLFLQGAVLREHDITLVWLNVRSFSHRVFTLCSADEALLSAQR